MSWDVLSRIGGVLGSAADGGLVGTAAGAAVGGVIGHEVTRK
jgi:osmotically inducible lipoprotein OsmB